MSENNPYEAPSADPSSPLTGDGPEDLPLASLGDRFLGALIDGLIAMVISIPIVFGFIALFAAGGEASFMQKLQGGAAALGLVLGLVATVVIQVIYIGVQYQFWSSSSQSIGKKVMKTQIVDLAGNPADIKAIVVKRHIVMVLISQIPFIGGLIGLVDVLLVFRKDRNCLHDDIAGTRVVKLPA